MAKQGSEFRFRVSDALVVPLRGMLLRLRVQEGTPSIKDLAPGRRLRLTSPTGESRELTITAHAATGGRQTQKRLEGLRELDVIVSDPTGSADVPAVDIGWVASGPVEAKE